MACMNPVLIHWNKETEKHQFKWSAECDPSKSIPVPCGRCPECAKKWRNQLAQRALFEMMKHRDKRTGEINCCFLTLTLDLAEDRANRGHKLCEDIDLSTKSLTHEPVKKFFKRLRARLNYERAKELGISERELDRDDKVKFSYLVAGEYGEAKTYVDSKGRVRESKEMPHWHVLVFGWKPDDIRFVPGSTTKRGHKKFKSELLDSVWKFGWIEVGEVNENTVPYMAKYITKFKDIKMVDFKNSRGQQVKKPYMVYPHEMLGKEWFMENYDQLLRLGYLTASNGSKIPLPPCFIKLAEKTPYMKEAYEYFISQRDAMIKAKQEELAELGYVTAEERYKYAIFEGERQYEEYRSYMEKTKGIVLPKEQYGIYGFKQRLYGRQTTYDKLQKEYKAYLALTKQIQEVCKVL